MVFVIDADTKTVMHSVLLTLHDITTDRTLTFFTLVLPSTFLNALPNPGQGFVKALKYFFPKIQCF